MAREPLLSVRNLTVEFPSLHRIRPAVSGVSFDLGREKVGIIGESGSGKSTCGRAIMRLHPGRTRITADRMAFMGQDLLTLPERRMRAIRGHRIAMILQDPKYSLNPVMTVGEQIAETVILHERLPRRAARLRAMDMLEKVHIRDPERVMRLYPHEVSGGMGQRVMISMMLIAKPALIIADEPTSALDVSIQAEILNLLKDLRQQQGLTYVLVSHDMAVVTHLSDRIAVMQNGTFVEVAPRAAMISGDLAHPYTRMLREGSLGYRPTEKEAL